MISYDYKMTNVIKADGEYEERTPSYKKQMHNVSTLTGRASTGKSTFMTFVALSAFGYDQSVKMNPKLQDKIRLMKESPNRQYNFSLTATNEKTGLSLELSAVKAGPECMITAKDSQDGEMTKERFLRKYRLIYDIPDEPMKRIQELIKETEDIQDEYVVRLNALRRAVHSINAEISSSERNGEEIKSCQGKISGFENQRGIDIEKQKRYTSTQQKLKQISVALQYEEAFNKYRSLKQALDQAIANKKEMKKVDRAALRKYKDTEKNIVEMKSKLHDEMLECTPGLVSVRDLIRVTNFEIWASTSLNYIVSSPKDLKSLASVSQLIVEDLKKALSESGEDAVDKKYHCLTDLKDLLSNYRSLDLSIADQPLISVINNIDAQIKELGMQMASIHEKKELIDSLTQCGADLGTLASEVESLGVKPSGVSEDGDDGTDQLQSDTEAALARYNVVCNEAIPLGINENNYGIFIASGQKDPDTSALVSLGPAALAAKIGEYENALKSIEVELGEGPTSLSAKIAYARGNLDALEGQKKSPYSDDKKILEELEKKITVLAKDLQAKTELMKSVVGHDNTRLDDDQARYISYVNASLGTRMGIIRHIGEDHEVKTVDILKEQVVGKDDYIIRFDDMGTGESQYAYVKDLLSVKDGRILIALFDEIEHMDPYLQEALQKEMEEQYKDGMLIIGITACPGSSTEVVEHV